MSRKTSGPIPEGGVIGRLPFEGWWLSEVSPTRRVPSHGDCTRPSQEPWCLFTTANPTTRRAARY